MGRIYTNIVTIGSINIYNVVVDPNGILNAPIGSLAVRSSAGAAVTYQNQDGGSTWIQIGSTVITTATKSFGPTFTNAEANLIGPSQTVTVQFVAPEALTIQNIIAFPNLRTDGAVSPLTYNSFSKCIIDRMEIAGTGPDVGQLLDGVGVPGAVFTLLNLGSQPTLNWQMDAGDTLELDIQNFDTSEVSYQIEVTYVSGQTVGLSPKRFIGGPISPGAAGVIAGTTPAGGTIQITGAPAAAGQNIIIRSDVETWVSSNSVGSTLVGVAGARTPGSNNFDATLGTILALRDEILAALQDGANSFTGYTFAASGGDSITFTRNTPASDGAFGNYDQFTTTLAVATLTPATGFLSGGTSDPVNFSMAAPAVDMTIEKIMFSVGITVIEVIPSLLAPVPPEILDVTVNAAPSNISPIQTNAEIAYLTSYDVDIPVTAGDTLVTQLRGGATSVGQVCFIGTP